MRSIRLLPQREVTLKGERYEFIIGKRTYIMGILNLTPDSFSDGGSYTNIDSAIEQAKGMIKDGADIIDVGGESTRPGATEVTAQEEMDRVLPVVERLVKEVDVPISVDTYKAIVAEKALEAGVHIINDVWGLQRDPDMAAVIAKYKVPVVIMHNQQGTEYQKDIMESIKDFLQKSIKIALDAGIEKDKIILDPGIGFGKNYQHNVDIISRLGELKDLGYPILLGASRKAMIGKILDLPPKERVEGTMATTVMGIIQGIDFVRVHDIVEHYRAIKVTDAIVRGTE